MGESEVRKLLEQVVGISGEDWEVFRTGSPGVYRFYENLDRVLGHQVVAEVIDSRYCAAGLQVGQRFVIKGGALVPEKSTAPLCIRALGPLTGFVNTILEKLVAGEDPNERVFMTAECLDPGLEAGGLGKVRFRVWAEPAN
ncbi:MAG: hypothetical protein IH608_02050 [Proteobacteria bacterium]|nr:hypothetical protein [Pseudomonadota bacterium]